MLALLPFLSLLLVIIVIRKYQLFGWRGSILFGAVVWGLFITVVTEIYSIFNFINFWSILTAWIFIIFVLLLIIIFGKKDFSSLKISIPLKTLPDFEFFLLVCVSTIIIVVGIIAFIYPPTNYDSMTYHMARVMHWIQNHNINFYPTANLRQLHQNPWTEYAILHLQILNKGDLFANSVQWLFMIGNIIGASLIAKELKASNRGQLFASVFCATIPMAILQGSSTQTDGAVSFWLLSFIYFVLLIRNKVNVYWSFGAGIALGLALLTKATAYVFAFPFLVWLVISLFVKNAPKKWLALMLIAVIALAINSGHYVRNYNLYSNPLGPGVEEGSRSYANEVFSLSSVSSNLIRNLSLHYITPFPQINSFSTRVINYFHRAIKLAPNDERTTYTPSEFMIAGKITHEDSAPNLWHLSLIVIFLLFYIFNRHRNNIVDVYVLLLVVAFILFCGYLKWQPWNSRLHLPLFVLFSPFLGLFLSENKSSKVAVITLMLVLASSSPFLFQNHTRPLNGDFEINFLESRDAQYFNSNPRIRDIYGEAAVKLSEIGCPRVGLVFDHNSYEYPLWVILKHRINNDVFIEHVNVSNVSKNLDNSPYRQPLCAVLSINSEPPNEISVDDKVYSLYWSNDHLNLFLP